MLPQIEKMEKKNFATGARTTFSSIPAVASYLPLLFGAPIREDTRENQVEKERRPVMAEKTEEEANEWLKEARRIPLVDIRAERKKQLYRFLRKQSKNAHFWCKQHEITRLVCGSEKKAGLV